MGKPARGKGGTSKLAVGGLLGFAALFMADRVTTKPQFAAQAGSEASGSGPFFYERCDDARAAGAAPINAGEPGYRRQLDADGDGVACEPYRER